MDTVKKNKQEERPTIKHTSRGVLYADPKDILSSKVAQRQLEMIRKSDLLKKMRGRKDKR